MQRGGRPDHPSAIIFGIELVAYWTVRNQMVTILYEIF